MVWLTDKRLLALFPAEPLSEILTIGNLWYTASRIWICAEPEFTLSWMKLYSSDYHYTTAPQFLCNRCNGFVGIASFQRLCSNCFRLSCSSMFTNKATISLDDRLYWKISARRQGLLSQWKYSIGCTNFFIMASGQ